MNLYKVTTPTNSVCVLAEDANAAIECFIDALINESIFTFDYNINCIEQIASDDQPRFFKSDFPSRLVISIDGVKKWLETR